jgi:hypothetical protein
LSGKIAFGWVFHQHQPVGNFPWVFEHVYEVCYEPLIEAFERHSSIKVTMHFSGPLLDWLLAEHRGYVDRICALARRGQIEIMTGGYYEPILPIIPEYDQNGQILKMNAAIRQYFAVEPQGLWLAERVWEPSLPGALARSGVKYTVLDDTHFLMAGLSSDELYGYYITEDQGNSLFVVPNPKLMRELIPWKSVTTVYESFRHLADNATGDIPRLVVLGDDGEKFGSWPGTHEYIWKKGYFEDFLKMLEDNSDWIETVQMGDYINRYPPIGRVYMPTASYAEMMEWALPTERQLEYEDVRTMLEKENREDILQFIRGGIWRGFAAKYPEANNFHKKMLRVHNKVRSASTLLGPHKTQDAMNQLWMGQCNCGYWHGVFGGLYLPDIRSAIYQHLIRAEAIADSALPPADPVVSLIDFDCDGYDELLIEGHHMDVYISPHEGGSIFEWDWKPTPFNVLATLARRKEAYHRKLLTGNNIVVSGDADEKAMEESDEEIRSIHDAVRVKEEGLEKLLQYDPYRRTLLREHFFNARTTLEEFKNLTYVDEGDFASAAYEFRVEGVGADALVVDLWHDGIVVQDKTKISLRLRKVITVATGTPELRIDYTLWNTSTTHLRTTFAIEGNWGMLGGGNNPSAWYLIDDARPESNSSLNSTGTELQIRSVSLLNTGVGIKVSQYPGTSADLWRFPVEAVSSSEGGFERVYQCSCTVLSWPVDIPPGDRWSVTLRLNLSKPAAKYS